MEHNPFPSPVSAGLKPGLVPQLNGINCQFNLLGFSSPAAMASGIGVACQEPAEIAKATGVENESPVEAQPLLVHLALVSRLQRHLLNQFIIELPLLLVDQALPGGRQAQLALASMKVDMQCFADLQGDLAELVDWSLQQQWQLQLLSLNRHFEAARELREFDDYSRQANRIHQDLLAALQLLVELANQLLACLAGFGVLKQKLAESQARACAVTSLNTATLTRSLEQSSERGRQLIQQQLAVAKPLCQVAESPH